MSSNLTRFSIEKLWGEKDISLRFQNNRLILVGENGSGKTTILRIVYETLACRWAQLSVEDFSAIKLEFSEGAPIIVTKDKLISVRELFVDQESPIIGELPPPIRRNLIEQSNISGRDISYDQILDALDDYGYKDKEIYSQLKEKISSVETTALSEYSKDIKERLNCSIIYHDRHSVVCRNIRCHFYFRLADSILHLENENQTYERACS